MDRHSRCGHCCERRCSASEAARRRLAIPRESYWDQNQSHSMQERERERGRKREEERERERGRKRERGKEQNEQDGDLPISSLSATILYFFSCDAAPAAQPVGPGAAAR